MGSAPVKYTAGKDAAVQSGLVIIGEEEMDDYGDSVVPLFTAYPQREPIWPKAARSTC